MLLTKNIAQRRTKSVLIVFVFVWVAVAAGRPAAQGDRPSPGQGMSLTQVGCLVDEAAFARATGLARVDRDTPARQLVFTDRNGSTRPGAAFAVTGGREQELLPHAHVVVEVTGDVEGLSPTALHRSSPAGAVALPPEGAAPAATDAAVTGDSPGTARTPSGAAGVTSRGAAAHEPGDAAAPLPGAATDAPPDAGTAAASGDLIAIADLPRLNVRTFRVVGGSCAESLIGMSASEQAAAPRSSSPPPVPAATRSAALEKVAMTGCVIREQSAGTPSGGTPSSGALLLTRATRTEPRAVQSSGAVPGSLPSGAGTGTVAARPQPARPADSNATDALTFTLEERAQHQLATFIGQRVSIEGTLRTEMAARQTPSAHSTAPAGTLVVDSVRSIGGECR